jgi:erythromycin 3''-O-methyltransferase
MVVVKDTSNNVYGSPSFNQRFLETLQLLLLLVSPKRTRTTLIYDVLSTHNHLGEQSLFLNLGYWDGVKTYDQACTNLAHLVGETAKLNPQSTVLDCGFGYGDQDDYWMKTFKPKKIDAINITRKQIDIAKARFPHEKIAFQYGSATALPFSENVYDRVLALESPFHFHTRTDFFAEAFRVLKQNGLLVTADVIKGSNASGIRYWFAQRMGCAFWQIPSKNLISVDEYRKQLEDTGFSDITIRDISASVFDPFKVFARERTNSPEVKARLNPLIRMIWRTPNTGLQLFSYIIVSARKPDSHP